MELNMGAIKTLLREKFNDNQSQMAEEFGISRYQFNMILKSNGKKAGKKVIGAVMSYCKNKGYNYEDYIFLE